MINDFDFCQPRSVTEALEAVSQDGRIVPIAGGTNVLASMKQTPLDADWVVDLTRIEDLKAIQTDGDSLKLGSAVTLATVLEWHPGGAAEGLLRPMAQAFAGPLIRNLATIGGNICDASPAADCSPPLLALNARVRLESLSEGERWLGLEDFFLGVRKTARRADELLTSIAFPRPPPDARCFYYKLGKRKADAISIVSVAMLLRLESGIVDDARIALGAVAPVAMRARKAEGILRGERPSASVLAQAATTAAAECRPIDDFRAGASYRRSMVENLVLRGLKEMTGVG
jgi:CO/xanthine dehydrogenase FAD-binding subunit